MAFGLRLASGRYSIAMGELLMRRWNILSQLDIQQVQKKRLQFLRAYSEATQRAAIALGYTAKATDQDAMALGSFANASANSAVALGPHAKK